MRVHRVFAAVSLALLATSAAAFPTDLEIDAGALEVLATASSNGRMAIVQISNPGPVAVRCETSFRNGPETGPTRRTTLEPGDSAVVSWIPRRQVVRVRVVLSCVRQEEL